MLGDLKDRFMQQLRPSTGLKAELSRLKNDVKRQKESNADAPLVGENVGAAEFSHRYSHLRFAAYFALTLSVIAMVQGLVYATAIPMLIGTLIFLMGGMYYLTMSFRAWVARDIWRKWSDRDGMTPLPMKVYLDAAGNDPRELLVLPLRQEHFDSLSRSKRSKANPQRRKQNASHQERSE